MKAFIQARPSGETLAIINNFPESLFLSMKNNGKMENIIIEGEKCVLSSPKLVSKRINQHDIESELCIYFEAHCPSRNDKIL